MTSYPCHSAILFTPFLSHLLLPLVNREGMPPHIFSELEKLQLSGSIEFPSGECKEGDVDDLEKRVSAHFIVPLYLDPITFCSFLKCEGLRGRKEGGGDGVGVVRKEETH